MKKLILLYVGILLGASTCMADHESFLTSFRGVAETPTGKVRVTEADILGNPANFLVTNVDLDGFGGSANDFDLEEWSDTNADGIPDTFVASLFGDISVAALLSGKFGATIRGVDPADGSVDLEPTLTVRGKARFEFSDGESILGYVAAVVGQIDFDDSDGPQLITGRLRTVGPAP